MQATYEMCTYTDYAPSNVYKGLPKECGGLYVKGGTAV
jgi:hypothetical protein